MMQPDLGVLVGRLIEKVKTLEQWQALWEARLYRLAILIGLWAVGLISQFSPGEVAEILSAVVKQLLIGS